MAADTNASLASTLGITKYLNFKFYELLHDVGDLKEICEVVPFQPGMGSLAMSLRFMQPVDAMSLPGEDTAPSYVNLTTANSTLTVAKNNLYRGISDEGLISGVMTYEQIAKSFASSLVYQRSALIAALGAGFTGNTAVGSTGVPITVDTVYQAMFALTKAKALRPYDLVLHQTGLTQFQDSLRSETMTPLALQAGSQISAQDGGVVMEWQGVRIRSHGSVPKINANADYSNFMVGRQAIFFTEAPVQSVISQYAFNPVTVAGENAIIVQDLSQEAKGTRAWILHYYPGVVEGIDTAGVQVVGSV